MINKTIKKRQKITKKTKCLSVPGAGFRGGRVPPPSGIRLPTDLNIYGNFGTNIYKF